MDIDAEIRQVKELKRKVRACCVLGRQSWAKRFLIKSANDLLTELKAIRSGSREPGKSFGYGLEMAKENMRDFIGRYR